MSNRMFVKPGERLALVDASGQPNGSVRIGDTDLWELVLASRGGVSTTTRTEHSRGLARVEVQYQDQSQPIVYEGVLNTYEKGGAFCVMMADGKTVYKHNGYKWWRVKEVSP